MDSQKSNFEVYMTFLLSKSLAEHIFEAFSIQRWNDRIRVIDLNEMDKNAYKMMLTYFIGRVYESKGNYLNWQSLIDRGVYDLLIRISTSDIKASLHSRLRLDKATYNSSVSKLLENDLEDKVKEENFIQSAKDFISNNHKGSLTNEDLVLRLSHNLSVRREFDIVSSVSFNTLLPEHNETLDDLNREVEYYARKLDLEDYIRSDNFKNIMLSIDQLRFQQRWSQTQRIPKTNVLGHSFYVALLCYFSTRYILTSSIRLRNNFYSALMHDFLESYTRDVINPVKLSSKYFNTQIAAAEEEAFKDKLQPLLEDSFAKHFEFLIKDEFSDRKFDGTDIFPASLEDSEQHGFEYTDGTIIKACDSLAALIEAHQSIELGVSSRHLQGAITKVYASYVKSNPSIVEAGVSIPKGFINNSEIRLGISKIYNEFVSS